MQKQTFKLFWQYSKRYPVRRFFALAMPVLAVCTSGFIGPLILAEFINRLQAGSVTLASSWSLIGLFFIVILLGEVVFWRISLWATWSFEVRGQRDLYVDIFEKLSFESMSFHSDRFSGSLVSQTSKLVSAYEKFWDMIIWQTIPVVTTIAAAITILSFVYWPYAIFIAVVAIVFALTVFLGSRFLRERNIVEAQTSSKLSGFVADMVTNILTVKSYANEADETVGARATGDFWLGTSLHAMWGFVKISTVYAALLVLLSTGALILAVIASEQQLLTIGAVYLMLTYTLHVSRQLWEMNNIMRNYYRIMGDSYDMVEILGRSDDISDANGTSLAFTHGKLVFDDVTFAHPGSGEDAIFQNFDLTITPGQRVGLVGHSGSGKTTFTRLLLRFMDVDSGAIKIDDQNIADVSQASVRRAIAYVPQEPLLFHRSLEENIAYGKPHATRGEVIAAAKKANSWEFIESLPEGLNTLVGERGVKLSGGQRQRIVIARAILKDAPILVLDEATSALDSESEKLIQASLENLMKGRTSIVIAHRLSTIAKLDRIIVLDTGKIVEDGTHAELLSRNGVYGRLWAHQSGGFLDE